MRDDVIHEDGSVTEPSPAAVAGMAALGALVALPFGRFYKPRGK